MTDSKKVIGVEQVELARARLQTQIEISASDIVTDLARETAAQAGIAFVDGPQSRTATPAADSATRTQRELFRRSPKWVAPKVTAEIKGRSLSKLALIGAGGVGSNIAHLAANANMAETISLVDIVPGLAASTALDLQHASGITGSYAKVEGGNDYELIADAQVVVVTAGKPRTPGMSRSDLITINTRVIQSSAEAIKRFAPNAIVIVVTNPLDEMTTEMLRTTEFSRNRVLGMAGTLDSSRFRRAIASAAKCNTDEVQAVTIGSHGDEMVPLTSMARIKGRRIDAFLNKEQIDACVRETIHGGGSVVALRKTGSATLAPAHAVLEIVDHLRGARSGWVPVSIMLNGEFGVHDVVLGVPARLGPDGVQEIVEVPLSEAESALVNNAAAAIKERLSA